MAGLWGDGRERILPPLVARELVQGDLSVKWAWERRTCLLNPTVAQTLCKPHSPWPTSCPLAPVPRTPCPSSAQDEGWSWCALLPGLLLQGWAGLPALWVSAPPSPQVLWGSGYLFPSTSVLGGFTLWMQVGLGPQDGAGWAQRCWLESAACVLSSPRSAPGGRLSLCAPRFTRSLFWCSEPSSNAPPQLETAPAFVCFLV